MAQGFAKREGVVKPQHVDGWSADGQEVNRTVHTRGILLVAALLVGVSAAPAAMAEAPVEVQGPGPTTDLITYCSAGYHRNATGTSCSGTYINL